MSNLPALVKQWRSSLAASGRPNEWEVKQLLKGIGIAVPQAVLIEPGAAAQAAGRASAAGLAFPCAAKVCSGLILHKTEQGGVLLDLAEPELPAAVRALQQRFPDAGVLIEEMVRYRGSEVIIGALHDPTFGPAVMAGAGGILTELYRDVSFRLAPCSSSEARRLLEELTIYPTLTGYRGLSADVEALATVIERVAELSLHLIEGGCQLDINPLVWAGKGWVALDAKVVL